jgi:RNA polymerase sigma-70 factor, ECF subfamily
MLLREISARNSPPAECRHFAPAACENGRVVGSPPAPPLTEDAALVEGLRRGDDAAFEQMVRKFGGRLLATARRYLRSEDDAHDALQDAFLCAFRSINNFKGDSRLSTWLHRIVINSALMLLRAERRRPDVQAEQIDELLPRFEATGNWRAQFQNSLPACIHLEIAETRALIRRCIDELPEKHRLVLILRDVDGLETHEAAALLGLTTNNIKVRLHRARQALRALIQRTDLVTTAQTARSVRSDSSQMRFVGISKVPSGSTHASITN